jgi:hypothetical protein
MRVLGYAVAIALVVLELAVVVYANWPMVDR